MHDTTAVRTRRRLLELTERPLGGPDRELFAPLPQLYPCFGRAVAYIRRREACEVPLAALPYVFHRHGVYPALDPVTPGDIAATSYWRFGIDPTTEIHDQTQRPIRRAAGNPLTKLFGV